MSQKISFKIIEALGMLMQLKIIKGNNKKIISTATAEIMEDLLLGVHKK